MRNRFQNVLRSVRREAPEEEEVQEAFEKRADEARKDPQLHAALQRQRAADGDQVDLGGVQRYKKRGPVQLWNKWTGVFKNLGGVQCYKTKGQSKCGQGA
jgi:hypothetical protein